MLAVAPAQLHPLPSSSKDPDSSQNVLAAAGLSPIEFEEGSSSGTLGVPEGRFKPINEPPKASTSKLPPADEDEDVPVASTSKLSQSISFDKSTEYLPTHWPRDIRIGSGLYNQGNTCFLNSALQCLLHTPPLLHAVLNHPRDCPAQDDGFCITCSFRRVAQDSFKVKGNAFSPSPILHNLHKIAKSLRRGRQEDAHEFLRFLIDAMQKACLHGQPKKVDPAVAEATWVSRVFGGKLRSRVRCCSCNHPSDTFDSILDLSLDIQNASSVHQALKHFVAIDHLRGADKYKCEKCKKPVNAEKQFTIDSAPLALTVHLKRFTPFGRKLAHVVQYKEHLSLAGAMSKDAKEQSPQYKLYGVICHAGSGPNSGHYYAFTKGPNGRWYEMNDDAVSLQTRPPLDLKSAYMLFYLRDEASALNDIIATDAKGKGPDRSVRRKSMPELHAGASRPTTPVEPMEANRSAALAALSEGLKKKKLNSAPPVAAPVAGPSKPKTTAPLPGLADYRSEGDDEDDLGEKVDPAAAKPAASSPAAESVPISLPPSSPPPATSSPAEDEAMIDLDEDDGGPSTTANPKVVPAATFYGSSSKASKRMRDADDDENGSSPMKKHRSSSPPVPSSSKRRSLANPFSGIHRNGHDIHKKRNKGHGLLDIEPTSHTQRRKPGL
ncbi:cysteine proteinase [Auricularia subglabra TFB-10046 SS5]|nr:cysteine proteinase [Auricularia subglabra TFB-10046 SS5]